MRTSPGTCHLPKICGLEDSVVALIADFAGVARGRQLRNLREASECLPLNNQSLSEEDLSGEEELPE